MIWMDLAYNYIHLMQTIVLSRDDLKLAENYFCPQIINMMSAIFWIR